MKTLYHFWSKSVAILQSLCTWLQLPWVAFTSSLLHVMNHRNEAMIGQEASHSCAMSASEYNGCNGCGNGCRIKIGQRCGRCADARIASIILAEIQLWVIDEMPSFVSNQDWYMERGNKRIAQALVNLTSLRKAVGLRWGQRGSAGEESGCEDHKGTYFKLVIIVCDSPAHNHILSVQKKEWQTCHLYGALISQTSNFSYTAQAEHRQSTVLAEDWNSIGTALLATDPHSCVHFGVDCTLRSTVCLTANRAIWWTSLSDSLSTVCYAIPCHTCKSKVWHSIDICSFKWFTAKTETFLITKNRRFLVKTTFMALAAKNVGNMTCFVAIGAIASITRIVSINGFGAL